MNGNFSTEMYTQEAERIISTHDPSEVKLVMPVGLVGCTCAPVSHVGGTVTKNGPVCRTVWVWPLQ